jgi:hypothetical protein
MTTVADDRLSKLRQQLSDSVARLTELDAAAINAVIEGKTERDISAIETRKAQARDRIVLLQKSIKHLEHQQQLDAQASMMRSTMAFIEPLTKTLDEGAAKLALPPHVPDKPVQLEPDVVKPKQVGKWFGNPKEGGRWNERAR